MGECRGFPAGAGQCMACHTHPSDCPRSAGRALEQNASLTSAEWMRDFEMLSKIQQFVTRTVVVHVSLCSAVLQDWEGT